jgi:hypothetical protein
VLIQGRSFWKLHGRWLAVTLALAATAISWTVLAGSRLGRWPGGGTWSGLILGSAAAVIFLFECALALKKTPLLRTARWSLPAQTWMKAHIWLGLLTVPLVVLHSGGRLGSALTTLLVVVFAVVIGSGLWGLALQNLLPRMLLESAPAETIYSQIDNVGRQYAAEARRLVANCCGENYDPLPAASELPQPAAAGGVVVHGAPRQVGPQIRRSPQPAAELQAVIDSPAIRAALDESIAPFLAEGICPRGLLGSRQRNEWFFDDLQLRAPPELRQVVGQLAALCERRRQLNVQRRLHFWLHNWLWLHLPLSLALLVLVAGHIVFALRFE